MPRLICPNCQKEFDYEPTEVAGEQRSMPLISFFQRIKVLEEAHRRADNEMANWQKKVKGMDSYLDRLGAENTDLKERIVKLENLTNPEAGQ